MASHGIMYHHFHDNIKHIKEQGSITGKDLENMLDYYSERYNIINADEYLYKVINDNLTTKDVCLTFDDNLLCQYDIAIPILNKRKITAFYFAYSSPLIGKLEKLEIYRHFRHLMFKNIEDFYNAFFLIIEDNISKLNISKELCKKFNPDVYLIEYKFYSLLDRKFRYYRDIVLGTEKYYKLMDTMIHLYNYDVNENANLLWCKDSQLRDMANMGHIIGLHSHSHPTRMCDKTYQEQYKEYQENKAILEDCIKTKIIAASYPCGSMNQDTIPIMKDLGIKIAFKERMLPLESYYMLAREDHSNIMKEMKNNENNDIYK